MSKVELIMPKMGESIMEATILNWVKKVGDEVKADETILEIATDKVDSEIPSPVDGVITEIKYDADTVVEVGKVIAMISTSGEVEPTEIIQGPTSANLGEAPPEKTRVIDESIPYIPEKEDPKPAVEISSKSGDRFYSPLVRNIAKEEGISQQELDAIVGSGAQGRVTKRDIMLYLDGRAKNGKSYEISKVSTPSGVSSTPPPIVPYSGGNDEIIQMDRMRKMIADHMVKSKHTSPHVTSFVEADVTNIVNWRNKIKGNFQQQYGEKITFTPIFIEAVVSALKDFPMVNVSVDGDKIVVKKNLNIGMAAALPSGNLIVPVIKNADHLNLVGITRTVNDLAKRARQNKLKPDEIQGGTFTLTNVGTFGNLMGTPIINQPQVAIMATGAIKKKPAVIETEMGDVIAVRSMMFLSLSYDHRVVDGFLGGSFLRRVADNLEAFDPTRKI